MHAVFDSEYSYAAVTAYYAVSLSEFHMNPHGHDSCEIMYVTSGCCLVRCREEEYRLQESQFVFIDAGVTHELFISQGQPCSVLNLEFQYQREESAITLAPLFQNSSEVRAFREKNLPFVVSGDLRNLGYALKDVIACLKETRGQEDYLLNLLFQRMLLELAFCVNRNKKTAGLYYLKKACAYIEENLCEPMKVPEIAAFTGVNKSYLQLLFSRFLHGTVIDYVNQKRLERAVFYLVNSTLHITEIAFSTGYNSRQHFAHTFEKYYGMSPQKYRKLHARILAPDTEQSQVLLGSGSGMRKAPLISTKEQRKGGNGEL